MIYCEDCKYFRLDRDFPRNREKALEYSSCQHDQSVQEGTLLSRELKGSYCTTMRSMSTLCGKEARYFEPKLVEARHPTLWQRFVSWLKG